MRVARTMSRPGTSRIRVARRLDCMALSLFVHFRHPGTAFVSTVLWVAVWTASTPAAAGSTPDVSPATVAAREDDVLSRVNAQRARGGSCDGRWHPPAAALVMNDRLRRAARGHSERMAAGRFYSHVSPDGRSFGDRLLASGYAGALPWAENIAVGFDTPRDVVDSWLRTGTHCTNILSSRFKVMGVGYAFLAGSPYGHYWTQTFGGS
jgi:uncharacterized protein YkwD